MATYRAPDVKEAEHKQKKEHLQFAKFLVNATFILMCIVGTGTFVFFSRTDANEGYTTYIHSGKGGMTQNYQTVNVMSAVDAYEESTGIDAAGSLTATYPQGVDPTTGLPGGASASTAILPGTTYDLGPLSDDAEEIRQKLLANASFAAKADILARTYDVFVNEQGKSKEAAIGMMANIMAEGNYNTIEGKPKEFPGGCSSFMGPGHDQWTDNYIKSVADIQTLLNLGDGVSVGVGSVQWSFGRRMIFCGLAKEVFTDDSMIGDSDKWIELNIRVYVAELFSPASAYENSFAKVESMVPGSGTPEDWAESFCRYYERPDHPDDASAKRRGFASALTDCLMD